MRTVRLASICLAAIAAATLVSGSAFAKGSKPVSPPSNLRGFLLRPSEPMTHVFSRTPAFAWSPVRGANCYEFELATSRSFTESAVVWSNVRTGVKPGGGCKVVAASGAADTSGSSTSGSTSTGSTTSGSTSSAASSADPAVSTQIQILRVPAVSVDVALPWFTGQPYALYAHVRAVTSRGPTGWSTPFAFNMRWANVPTPMQTQPGIVRWSPVAGATSYQVWYTDVNKVITTHTNVADQREYYTLHSTSNWWASVHWRVRAVRNVFGDIPNGLPVVSYGPWSQVYTASNPDWSSGKLTLQLALSDRSSDAAKQSPHELMPAFTFTGDQGLSGATYRLFRAYASTDSDCVNIVYRGAVVGSPAYAPRLTGPLKLPTGDTDIAAARNGWLDDAPTEGPAFAADGSKVTTSESPQTDTTGSGSTSSSGSSASTLAVAHVDLPDVDFPATRYYWTVVPVQLTQLPDKSYRYVDAEVPQDACAAGRVLSFGKESDPVQVASTTPYVAGLTPTGRLLAASTKKPTVFSTPLIAWEPATGATSYEVQWSRTLYPWRAQGSKQTYSTSAVLDLAPGAWFYRVRGLNQTQLRKPQMVWSAPVKLTVAKPKFRLVAAATK